MDSQKSFDERKHQINTYLKDIISITDSDELYIFDLLRLKQS
jgi:hypothetical protein